MNDERAGYQRVAALSDVPDGGCLAVECRGTPLVIVRRGTTVQVLENRCPHAGAPLSEGFIEGDSITCAWHGWTFDLATGRSLDDSSLAVPRFDVVVEGGDVLVRGVP